MADNSLDDLPGLGEPVGEALPPFMVANERRLHARAYAHWLSLLRGRSFPSLGDLEAAPVRDFAANGLLLDFTGNAAEPSLRWIGEELRESCGLAPAGAGLGDVPPRSLVARLAEHYPEILARRAPVSFEAEFASQRARNTLYRGILMPLSSDGHEIDFIYGVLSWKEVADPAVSAGLIGEIVEELARPFANRTAADPF